MGVPGDKALCLRGSHYTRDVPQIWHTPENVPPRSLRYVYAVPRDSDLFYVFALAVKIPKHCVLSAKSVETSAMFNPIGPKTTNT